MSNLSIQRWHNRYRSPQAIPADNRARWDGVLSTLDADIDLGLADDEWLLIRHLALQLRWRPDQGERQAATAWQQVLETAMRTAMQDGGNGVVRYRHQREAITDMLYRAACGDISRAWAWQQMGLLQAGEAAPKAACLAALRALQATPEAIWPCLASLLAAEAATGAWTTVMQALTGSDWQTLLACCPQTASYLVSLSAGPMALAEQAHAITPSTIWLPASGANPTATQLTRWIDSHPWLAQQQTAALTLLLAGANWPASHATTHALAAARLVACRQQVISSQATLLASASTRAGQRQTDQASQAATPTSRSPSQAGSAAASGTIDSADPAWATPAAEHDDTPPIRATDIAAPPLPDAPVRCASAWGGLLFLLHAIPASGLLDAPDDIDALRLNLYQLATQGLGIPAGDPAVRAFCGGWEPTVSTELSPESAGAQFALLAAIANWLAERLPDDGPSLLDICQRPAQLQLEPGWIEAAFPLDSIDTRLRRAGLDLDPGWLAWLGCVVRFSYE